MSIRAELATLLESGSCDPENLDGSSRGMVSGYSDPAVRSRCASDVNSSGNKYSVQSLISGRCTVVPTNIPSHLRGHLTLFDSFSDLL